MRRVSFPDICQSDKSKRKNDMWKIEKFAMIFLRSEDEIAPKLAAKMEIPIRRVTAGKSSHEALVVRKIAANENLRPKTANEIEPGHAAST